jgi:predicted DNA binding protein
VLLATYELVFKLQHQCPYNDLSKKFPTVVMSQWCDNNTEVLEASSTDPKQFQEFGKSLVLLAKGLKAKVLKKKFVFPDLQMVSRYRVDGFTSVDSAAEKNHCLVVYPVTHIGGWEWYRVVGFSDRDVKGLFRDLDKFCTVEMVSRKTKEYGAVRDTYLIARSSLVGNLTAKQYEALASALENGYYLVPKRTTTDVIAAKLRVPRTTYEEHLRKAESKLLGSVAPYMQLTNDAA